jgi:hypothetical protein
MKMVTLPSFRHPRWWFLTIPVLAIRVVLRTPDPARTCPIPRVAIAVVMPVNRRPNGEALPPASSPVTSEAKFDNTIAIIRRDSPFVSVARSRDWVRLPGGSSSDHDVDASSDWSAPVFPGHHSWSSRVLLVAGWQKCFAAARVERGAEEIEA